MADPVYPLPALGRPADDILKESDDFFVRRGPIYATVRKLAESLRAEAIDYAILGGMALNLFGYRRETVDVDLLLTAEGLQRFRDRYLGRGYTAAFPGARKTFRDAETGVRIEVLVTGEYPGDGRPKPVSFPDPSVASVDRDGYRVLGLEKLIELKIASGISAEHRRLIDLADVQRLIEELRLPADFSEKLDQSVRDEYRQIWRLAQQAAEGPQERP